MKWPRLRLQEAIEKLFTKKESRLFTNYPVTSLYFFIILLFMAIEIAIYHR